MLLENLPQKEVIVPVYVKLPADLVRDGKGVAERRQCTFTDLVKVGLKALVDEDRGTARQQKFKFNK